MSEKNLPKDEGNGKSPEVQVINGLYELRNSLKFLSDGLSDKAADACPILDDLATKAMNLAGALENGNEEEQATAASDAWPRDNASQKIGVAIRKYLATERKNLFNLYRATGVSLGFLWDLLTFKEDIEITLETWLNLEPELQRHMVQIAPEKVELEMSESNDSTQSYNIDSDLANLDHTLFFLAESAERFAESPNELHDFMPGLAMSIERSRDDVRKTRKSFRKLVSMASVKEAD